MIILKNWEIIPLFYGTTSISGNVYNHPNERHYDGKRISTSSVVSFDKENSIIKTKSGTEYKLETSDVNLLNRLSERIDNFLDSQKDYFRIKNQMTVKNAHGDDFEVLRDDVLIKKENNKYTCRTSHYYGDLYISDTDVENWDEVVCFSSL